MAGASRDVAGAQIRLRGLVQGVGMRPAVWRLARELGLGGEVRNDAAGVLIRAWGGRAALDALRVRLASDAPPLARIDALEVVWLDGEPPGGAFRIAASAAGAVNTGIVPDAAACAACVGEVFDPRDRRHRYAFTNCTHCGPRLSIVRGVPYDRASTAMHGFEMCARCAAEYADPADRRFHAQPNACAACGPRVWLEGAGADAAADPVDAARRLIEDGAIVAIKGIGGFHLACDAANEQAVSALRARKQRHAKPLALMASDLATVREHCRVSEREAALLASAEAPIVVLERLVGSDRLAPGVAPGQGTLGFMLPYTPLHHLLLRGFDRPIVLTSGNLAEEPQCIDNDDARLRLRGIADGWLMHDRPIVNRLDDSLVRVTGGQPRVLRRARGYAPAPLVLPPGFERAPAVLAMGGELKSTFCLLSGGLATVSAHLGDLEDAATYAEFRDTLALYRRLLDFAPAIVAHDLHRDYLSTRWGAAVAAREGVALEPVQHHHAHVAACLLEHGRERTGPPVLAVTLDGLGLGDDGTAWGGEILAADYAGARRLAHFAPVALVGGGMAMREPWRNAHAHLRESFGWDEVVRRWPQVGIVRWLSARSGVVEQMIERNVNCPRASSGGRLFDAVAAALGLCRESVAYEGQAAIELEALAARAPDEPGAYGFELRAGDPAVLSWRPLWRGLMDDLASGLAPARVAARFHNGLVAAVDAAVARFARPGDTVVLTGGVFQNRLLLEGVIAALGARSLETLSPSAFPANDGGLSLGQAAVAAARACAAETSGGRN